MHSLTSSQRMSPWPLSATNCSAASPASSATSTPSLAIDGCGEDERGGGASATAASIARQSSTRTACGVALRGMLAENANSSRKLPSHACESTSARAAPRPERGPLITAPVGRLQLENPRDGGGALAQRRHVHDLAGDPVPQVL